MIHNDLEYKITKSMLARLVAVADNSENSTDLPEWVSEAHKKALISQISELKEAVEEYERREGAGPISG